MADTTMNREDVIERIGAGGDSADWKDWRWQIKHAVRDIDTLERVLDITFAPEVKAELKATIDRFPFSATPYYLSLVDPANYEHDPVFKQAVPDPRELITYECEMKDPLAEDRDSPVPGITHRYVDRVLMLVSNTCSMYCRHCTRKRKVGDAENIPTRDRIDEGLDYIRKTPYVRDVLLSGGDPFMLRDEYLDYILTELHRIPHVEVVRIGTRMPAVLPYRVSDELVEMLSRHQPLWINTHFNHPREISAAARNALAKMADAGIPLGNQSVLLAGVNDCPRIIKRLGHLLVQNRVRPYYIYQCDLSEGLSHFRTPVGKGIEIIENLIGHTSGFSIPRYVIDAPGGGGKIPIQPDYVISRGTNKVVLRNHEGVITVYEEPDSYQPTFCDRKCTDCDLELDLSEGVEHEATGIFQLLSEYDDTTSLTPEGTERFERRD